MGRDVFPFSSLQCKSDFVHTHGMERAVYQVIRFDNDYVQLEPPALANEECVGGMTVITDGIHPIKNELSSSINCCLK